MSFQHLIDLLKNEQVIHRQIEEFVSNTPFYLSEIPDKPEAKQPSHVLLEQSDRKCGVRIAPLEKMAIPKEYSRTKKMICILQNKIQYEEFSLNQGVLTSINKELVGTGETLMISPGKIHRFFSAEEEKPAILVEILLSKEHDFSEAEYSEYPISDSDATLADYYYGYDERYRKVYEEGGTFWETEEPNPPVVWFEKQYGLKGKKVLDLGCGEGRDSIFLAKRGVEVTGVDVSRAALDKARERSRTEGVSCNFIERDVLYLRNISANDYDFALNMGCLHMITDPKHRRKHLSRVHEILKPGGYFLLAHCREKWLKGFFSVPDYEKVGPVVPGRVIDRKIRTEDGTKMIPLELLPYKESSADELTKELEGVGFSVVEVFNENTFAFGNTNVLVARKPAE
ncbi:class I SAM-dependent methyltransferase [Salinithrix halophila]|uniref:Class I SAM-dependent methyltransferase n=1 Tax=Salinithrix halophila TaxID=1485204 RepID=A0ABV8JGP8_9BACL